MESKEKIRLLKDYIAVVQGEMSKLFFCERHDINFQEFTKIAYQIEAELVAENERLKLKEENRWIPVSKKPKKRGRYIVVIDRTKFGGDKWWSCVWWTGVRWDKGADNLIRYLDSITHWKPIVLPDHTLKENQDKVKK